MCSDLSWAILERAWQARTAMPADRPYKDMVLNKRSELIIAFCIELFRRVFLLVGSSLALLLNTFSGENVLTFLILFIFLDKNNNYIGILIIINSKLKEWSVACCTSFSASLSLSLSLSLPASLFLSSDVPKKKIKTSQFENIIDKFFILETWRRSLGLLKPC